MVDRAFGDAITVTEETAIPQVAATLDAEDVGCVVVAEDGKPTGILTDRQVALALKDEPDVERLTAGELMTPAPVTVERGTDVFHVIQVMNEEGVRRLPIVDDDGDLDGLVSMDDVVVLLGEEMGNVAGLVEEQV